MLGNDLLLLLFSFVGDVEQPSDTTSVGELIEDDGWKKDLFCRF